jgi:Uma2 family endonuclease
MAERAARLMTEAEFLDWQRGQELRYELVDGFPQAMTGAKVRHDIARGNAEGHLRQALRGTGSGCLPFGADIAIRVYPGQLRRPEVSVVCPPFDMDEMVSGTPRLVLEVLSDGTRRIDEHIKLDEYKALASMDYIVLMSPTEIDVAVWSRGAQRQWQRTRYRSLADVVPLPLLGVSLPLAMLYEGIEIRPDFPKAVEGG